LGELPESIRIAEGGFTYSDDEDEGFDGLGGGDEDDEEEEKKAAFNINDI
jgi:hypothetical protein